ncbi:MAG TPA: hypothetical protein VNQ73_17250 [Ilumatobacter sp.]|nr:hypothetical protein [Ilumatobacter sp.]
MSRARFTVALTAAVTAVLHVPWALWLATGWGDLAAQEFWADAADRYPGSAYNFATYGGLHVAGYSLISPYVMAWAGVRLATAIAAVVAAALVAVLVVRVARVERAWVPSLVAAVVLTGNSVSGRSTFAIGTAFALAAVVLAFALPTPATRGGAAARVLGVATCSALATLGSPVAGLYIGLLAAAVWLSADDAEPGTRWTARAATVVRRPLAPRRVLAYALGGPPAIVVLGTAALFPFSGEQPMPWVSVIAPTALGALTYTVAPRDWRTVRTLGLVYVVAVVGSWLVPSPIGTNITRLGLIFAGVLLATVVCSGRAVNPLARFTHLPAWATPAAAGALGALIWALALPTLEAVQLRPHPVWTDGVDALTAELHARGADLTRVEVVPARSHVETPTLAPEFTLARGWNRQADLARNPLFYGRTPLDATTYRAWLDRWAVGYVVVAPGSVDAHARSEAELVAGGLDYLEPVWGGHGWQVYAVADPSPLVSGPAEVIAADPAHLTVRARQAGEFVVKMLHSPWLGVVDADGRLLRDGRACIARDRVPDSGSARDGDAWTVLRVTEPGDYTIAAPYALDRGSPCPTP